MAVLNHTGRLRLPTALGLALLCCGDPLVDNAYQGEVLLSLKGNPRGEPPPSLSNDHQHVRGALFWLRGLANPRTFDDVVEQPETSTFLEMPWSFDWPIYDRPQAPLLMPTRGPGHFGVAMAMLYIDRNDNHHREPDEIFIAQSRSNAVLFTDTDLTAAQSPLGRPLTAGYHISSTPLLCRGPMPAPPEPETDCGPQLGATCLTSADCGTGLCLTVEGWLWPQGYCAWPQRPQGCHPRGSVLWHAPESQPGGGANYWLKACTTDAECRAFPYQCDVAQGACMATAPVPLILEEGGPVAQPCAMPPPMP